MHAIIAPTKVRRRADEDAYSCQRSCVDLAALSHREEGKTLERGREKRGKGRGIVVWGERKKRKGR